MSVTKRIDDFIKMKNINKMEFARLSGIPYTTIMSLYNNGSADARLSTLSKIANVLNCTLDDLVNEFGREIIESTPDIIEILRANDDVLFDGKILTEKEKEKLIQILKLMNQD